MGRNYGHRRGRMEILRPRDEFVAYALSTEQIKFEHVDEQVIYDFVNKKLDETDKRIQDLA